MEPKQQKGKQVTDIPVTENTRKISVSFSRKISDGNYGSIEATAWVQGDAPNGATVGDTAVLIGDLFIAASSAVLDQLGIEYEMTEQGVIRETGTPAVTVTTVQAAEQAAARHLGASPVTMVKVMNAADQDGPLDDWLLAACQRDGITAVWDNRRQAKGTKKPWYTEAVPRGGTGHGKDGSGKGYWPPR